MQKRKEKICALLQSLRVIKHKLIGDLFDPTHSDITHAQWFTLLIVYKKGNLGIGGIAQEMGISSSAATQLVDGLVEKKYLVRTSDKDDHRALKIIISEQGKKKIEPMIKEMNKRFELLFNALDEKELFLYCELNEKIAKIIKQK